MTAIVAVSAGTVLVAAVAWRAVATRRPAGPAPTLNVMLITLDTTRADRLGCYGYSSGTSPRIDALAREGTTFERAVCTASVTPVSHASILTGLYPYSHGLRVLHGRTENQLTSEADTLAEVLAEAGYATGAVISAFPAGSRFGLDQGFQSFDESFIQAPLEEIVSPGGAVNTGMNQRRAGETTDLALRWLDAVQGPFFLWLHYFDPHDPRLLPPREFLDRFPVPAGPRPDQLRAIYDIEVRYMDEQIGRVLDRLAAGGLLDRTLVIVVSDHGEGLGDHDWWTHGILYEEQIRAALVVRAPGKPPGRRVEPLVRTIDIMPTVLDLAGLDAASRPDMPDMPDMDGVSLAALLAGDGPDPGLTAYADSVNMLTYAFAAGMSDVKDDILLCVTDRRWKYIHHLIREQESELYDLASDPRELVNTYGAQPEQAVRLMRDLKSRPFMPDRTHGTGRMTEEDLARLRSLGYLK